MKMNAQQKAWIAAHTLIPPSFRQTATSGPSRWQLQDFTGATYVMQTMPNTVPLDLRVLKRLPALYLVEDSTDTDERLNLYFWQDILVIVRDADDGNANAFAYALYWKRGTKTETKRRVFSELTRRS